MTDESLVLVRLIAWILSFDIRKCVLEFMSLDDGSQYSTCRGIANFNTCLLTANLGYLCASSVELRVWVVCLFLDRKECE